MGSIKISSKVEEAVWEELRQAADESNRTISGMLTEAVRDYLSRRRVRPEVSSHLDDSIRENRELGERLSR